MIDDFGVSLAERTIRENSEEHGMIKLNKFIALSEGRLYLADFRVIGQSRLKESKYRTENKDV